MNLYRKLRQFGVEDLKILDNVTFQTVTNLMELNKEEAEQLQVDMQIAGYTFQPPVALDANNVELPVQIECDLDCGNAPKMKKLRDFIIGCITYDTDMLDRVMTYTQLQIVLNETRIFEDLTQFKLFLWNHREMLKHVQISHLLSHGHKGAARVDIEDVYHQKYVLVLFVEFDSHKKEAGICQVKANLLSIT